MNDHDDEAYEERKRPPIPDPAGKYRYREEPRRSRDYARDDDRPRRRSRRHRDHEDDPLQTIIPYNNGMALAAYYCSVFGLIPVLGVILGPLAIFFGILGLKRVNADERLRGTGHAITGIVLGSIDSLINLAIVAFILIGMASAHR
jgi:hypothetical protein